MMKHSLLKLCLVLIYDLVRVSTASIDKPYEHIGANQNYPSNSSINNDMLSNAMYYSDYNLLFRGVSIDSIFSWNCKICTEHNRLSNIRYYRDEVLDAIGIVGVNMAKRSIVLIFRGTSSLENWFVNFDIAFNEFKGQSTNERVGNIHKGVYMYSQVLYEKYIDYIVELMHRFPGFEIVTTGRSLGGQVAITSAAKIRLDLGVIPTVYGFIYPQFADQQFADWVEKNINLVKIINQEDCVSKITFFGRFKHVGKTKFIITKEKNTIICDDENNDIEVSNQCMNDNGNELDFVYCIFEEQMRNHGSGWRYD